MKIYLALTILLLLSFQSCDWAANKAKQTANKTGRVVGKAGSEFASGLAEGVKETFADKATLSESLASKGLKLGKVLDISNDSTRKLSAYFSFQQDVNTSVKAIVFDEKGAEYGRATTAVSGKSGQAGYYDFVFDRRTDFGYRGRLVFE